MSDSLWAEFHNVWTEYLTDGAKVMFICRLSPILKKNVNSLLQALYTLYLDALFVFIKWYRNYSLNIQPLQKNSQKINL